MTRSFWFVLAVYDRPGNPRPAAIVGTADPFVQWVVVRPDSLLEGDVSEYALHEGLVSSLSRPDATDMASVARFMCELVVSPTAWDAWKGKLPVIINTARSGR